jgi:ATP synthase protein I
VAARGGRQDENRQQKREKDQEGSRERDTEELRARLDKLSTALDAQAEADKASDAAKLGQDGASAGVTAKAMGLAIRILSEFVAAVLVGAVIGWGIDRAAGTTPAFLVVFLLMGAAAGFWNVYRIAMTPPNKAG